MIRNQYGKLVPGLALTALLLGACASPETQRADEPGPSGPATVWDEARQRGVDFRALGNEPGWVLEIRDAPVRIDLSVDYGQTTHAFTDVTREAGSARTTYRAQHGAHSLEVVLEDLSCEDTMSGEAFETTVAVRLDGETLHGCGRTLR